MCATLGIVVIVCSLSVSGVSATAVGGVAVTVGTVAPTGLITLTIIGSVLAGGGIVVALLRETTNSPRLSVTRIYRISALICAAIGLVGVFYSRAVQAIFAEQVAAPAVAIGWADPAALIILTIVGGVLGVVGIVIALFTTRAHS